MNMKTRLSPLIILLSLLFLLGLEAKTMDPYKVLGVERNASQREIQKAFHKLSLQYHPDKNKNKGAQQKFAEINNAYEMLSDEEKRKNYDLYGDEKGNPGFEAGYPRGQGHTHFTNDGAGRSKYSFRPGQWQNMGGQGGSQSFSFSFGSPSGSNSFGFGMDDILSNLFGLNSKGWGNFGGFSGSSSGPQSGSKGSSKSIKVVTAQVFKKDVEDQGMTWLLLLCTSSLKGIHQIESIVEEVASSLQGALKVGSIDCKSELSLCNDLGIYPRRAPRVFVYSYISSNTGSLVEYSGDLTAKGLKTFCREHLPRFSKRVNVKKFDFSSSIDERLPTVMLLSTKRETPVIWRVLSGLYHKSFNFYDAEVHDVSDPTVRNLEADALPAIVGWLSNGEKQVLKSGIDIKDLESAIHDLSTILDGFEKKNRKAASNKASKVPSDWMENQIPPLLTGFNFDALCGESTPVCIIGVFRSSKARQKLESILSMVSRKSLSRRQNLPSGSKDSVLYALLDATKHSSFLSAFDIAGFKSSDQMLVAYKPRKGKFAVYLGEMSAEEAERFISSVLNGDIRFTKARQRPTFK